MSDLGSAFNRMTRQLSSQRDELIREHDISEQRRQFSEAVLSGVRAGVVGLSQEGRITLVNASAVRLLGMASETMLGQPVEMILPEFADAFRSAREDVLNTAEDQVSFETLNGSRIFDLRVSAYLGARKDTGWVLTFDDMTRLVAAQRHVRSAVLNAWWMSFQPLRECRPQSLRGLIYEACLMMLYLSSAWLSLMCGLALADLRRPVKCCVMIA